MHLPDISKLPLEEQRRLLGLARQLRETKAVEKARGSFIDYITHIWPAFISGNHHRLIAKAFDRIIAGDLTRLLINLPPRHCLQIDTPVLTRRGWKTMGSIMVGDEVFGPDGQPTRVLDKSVPMQRDRLWRVSDQYGESVLCDDGHLWPVALDRARPDLVLNKSAQWLAERQGRIAERGARRRPLLAMHAALAVPDADLPIDPYLFGVWLGDGHNAQAVITLQDADQALVRRRIEAAGYVTTDQKTRFTFGVRNLKVKLRELGVLGNKHIPARYLHASSAQLTALLHGLMDTDGNVSKDRQCFLATSSPALRDQYRELLWRLGIQNGLSTSRAVFNGRDYGECYRVGFYHDDVATLPRKAARAAGYIKPVRRYLSFTADGPGVVQCIQVAREDGLFLAGTGLLLTHNTKSEFSSWGLPSKYLGHYPERKIIQTSHTAELATGFGRRVRNLVASEEYQKVFPGTRLTPDSKAAGRWSTSAGGDYFAIGVGGAVAGKGADLLIIDDPHSEQDYISAISGNTATFDSTYEWFNSGPRQRLQPGGAIVVLMCMTGDTPVLRPDGTETPLQDLRPGDQVATYEDGGITISRVVNHQSSGFDTVYTIQTQSGRIVRANERHPFLVDRCGEQEWVRLRDLRVGDLLVSLRGVGDQPEPRPGRASVRHASPEKATIERTLMRQGGLWGITASGEERNANAGSRLAQEACAPAVTRRDIYLESLRHGKTGLDALKIVTALHWSSTKQWWLNATTDAMCVVRSLLRIILAPIGMQSCASTIAMTQGRFVGCFATTAILPLVTERPRKHFGLPQTICPDTIVSIEESGIEEVFDVEIERTENFIANGLVSHNTRWHTRDLTGRIIGHMTGGGGQRDQWEVIEFPALLPPDDKPLWPEFWSLEELLAVREDIPTAQWNAQYLQNPTHEEGALLKREWWRLWTHSRSPKCDYVIQCWDTAFRKTERSDYSACTTWGVFYHPDPDTGEERANIILLDAERGRWEFPVLKRKALELYQNRQPDALVVEGKASGDPLIAELRAMGIPVQDFTPVRGTKQMPNDKIHRVNAVTDMFASGMVWYPDRRWANEVREECAAFPMGDHDDYVDTVVMAMMRFRKGGFVRLDSDFKSEPMRRRRAAYY